MEYQLVPVSQGTRINFDLEKLQPFLDNDEAYIIWRMPHKTLDDIFKPRVDVGNAIDRLRDLITTPVVSEKYGYSIRINESRLLPEGVTRIGAYNRQKLKKAVVTLSIDESYELNDGGCYRIRRLEENLYDGYLPKNYKGEDIITYQWQQNHENSQRGRFNFYFNVAKNSVSKSSMFFYLVLLLAVGIVGDLLSVLIQTMIRLSVSVNLLTTQKSLSLTKIIMKLKQLILLKKQQLN